MKTRGTIGAALLVAVMAVVIVWGTAWGQTTRPGVQTYIGGPGPGYRQPQQTGGIVLSSPHMLMRADAETGEMQKLRTEDRKLEDDVQAALREYARTEEDTRKEELRRNLSDALQQQFEVRQEMRD